MPNTNLTGLAWAALVARWEPDGEAAGDVMVYRLDEPTLEIVLDDLEAERWEPVDEYLGLAFDEMLERVDEPVDEPVATEQNATELVVQVLTELVRTLTAAPTMPDTPEEATIEQPTTEQPVTEPIAEPFARFGAKFEPNRDGRYAVATCTKCKHRASGPLNAVLDAMEDHDHTHANRATKVTPRPAVKEKPRCATHGVWAREDDGRCKRCDVPSLDPEADDVMTKLYAAIALALELNPQVTQRVDVSQPSKLVLGVRGNGMLARRSAHMLAEATGLPQRDLAKMTAEEARALVIERGINADWVPAASL